MDKIFEKQYEGGNGSREERKANSLKFLRAFMKAGGAMADSPLLDELVKEQEKEKNIQYEMIKQPIAQRPPEIARPVMYDDGMIELSEDLEEVIEMAGKDIFAD